MPENPQSNCLHVAPLWPADLEFLRTLRNGDRQNFFQTTEITPDQQAQWYASLQLGREQHFILRLGFTRIGSFAFIPPKPDLPIPPGFDPDRTIYLSACMLAPEHRGRSLLATAVRPWLAPPWLYVGYVRVGNTSSVRFCEKIGMQKWDTYDHPTYGPMHCFSLDPQEGLDAN